MNNKPQRRKGAKAQRSRGAEEQSLKERTRVIVHRVQGTVVRVQNEI